MNELHNKTVYLSELGLQPAKIKQFEKKGIFTVDDLLCYFPKSYIDCTKETGILGENVESIVSLKFVNFVSSTTSSGKSMIRGKCVTKNQKWVSVFWFNQKWLSKKLTPLMGKYVLVVGKFKYSPEYDSYTVSTPSFFELDTPEIRRYYPIYKKIPGMSLQYLSGCINEALQGSYSYVPEIVPEDIVEKAGVLGYSLAIHRLHNPRAQRDIENAQNRIVFNDLLYFALHIARAERYSAKGSPFNISTLKSYKALLSALPYELTDDQKSAIDTMIIHARKGLRINALLQGDVGCGKSIVAFIMMAIMADSGCQSVLMAPTQVLAKQHYEDLQKLMEPLGFNVVFLHSGMKAKEKREILSAIADGTAQMIVGTHSVIGKSVVYKRLGLTIADEEHRFGVNQREALAVKAQDGVHAITMSATPIPRTLAHVIYGDNIQLLTIKTMPNGRLPVITAMSNGREKIYKFIRKQATLNHQIYVVCPMIDKNDDMEGVKSVEEVSAEYTEALEPYGVKVATLTGRNSAAETEETINRFKNGEINVLISTTVIEVGVNVPTATAIIITNAERFGLSSLHQLRGRVGRGNLQSFCVLESDVQTEEGRQRLEAMCNTNDGFEIAEADLKIRGAGDFIGTKQSGDNKYMSLMLAYPQKYEVAKAIADDLIDRGDDCCKLVAKVATEQNEAAEHVL